VGHAGGGGEAAVCCAFRMNSPKSRRSPMRAAPTFQAGEHDARELEVAMSAAFAMLRFGDKVGGRGTWLEQVQRSRGVELAARQSPGLLAAGLSHDTADAAGCSPEAAFAAGNGPWHAAYSRVRGAGAAASRTGAVRRPDACVVICSCVHTPLGDSNRARRTSGLRGALCCIARRFRGQVGLGKLTRTHGAAR
jgi:hypothetical protein